MKRRLLLQALQTAPALAFSPAAVFAQSAYPNKTIRYIVPVSAGGGSDMVGRTLTERWGNLLKQSFIVDNQAGGGGVIACQATARAAPDGYTLMQGYVATHGTSPATRKLPYDAVKDFTAVGMIGATPNVLVVNSALPVKNVKEFVEYVKKNPGKISYGSAGQGSLTHLTMELFKQQIDSFMVHIPYRLDRWANAGHVPRFSCSFAAHPLRPRAPLGGDRLDAAFAIQRLTDAGRIWLQRL
jgi:tripartite-type tricarboxylate transporter receptor subunit TctC